MRAAIFSSEIRTSRFGLLNSESNWADEVANLFLLFVQVLVEQEFACLPRCATYYASSSLQVNDEQHLSAKSLRLCGYCPDSFCGFGLWANDRDPTVSANGEPTARAFVN